MEDLASAARQLAEAEVRPTLPTVKGIDHHEYVETMLRRFANPALGHTTRQVAADGSLKIGPRLLGTITDNLSLSSEPRVATLAIAAWLRQILVQRADDGSPLCTDDPATASMLDATLGRANANVVRPALAAAGVNDELLEDQRFVSLVEYWYTELERAGALATVRTAAE